MKRHSALLLAAGGSTRLGRPKQILNIGGVPLVRHVAQLLLATRPEHLVVVTGGAEATIKPTLAGLDVVLVQNEDWQTGMASSLRCGYQALTGSSLPLLITGTDQPRLTEQHLHSLLEQDAGGKDVIMSYGEDGQGIPVLLSPTTQQHIQDLQGDTGLRQLWKNTQTAPICVCAPELGFDIDTPEQLDAALHAGWIDRD
ncbi:nucleotidyltransferase family protein [Gluconobacter sphaericus]|uniref:nucleotidyltransferase family protein n=1 Tax=Gluconobacter sphaericus TaxID=574987 RepID=UPI0019245401|nr:nucleotidyltransferase family protein [Gluconobacter sphaericus]QQX91559.1 nucleotidyltransferase family protein [Gluconobacter sphaericus]